jgi:hypothetical protein
VWAGQRAAAEHLEAPWVPVQMERKPVGVQVQQWLEPRREQQELQVQVAESRPHSAPRPVQQQVLLAESSIAREPSERDPVVASQCSVLH